MSDVLEVLFDNSPHQAPIEQFAPATYDRAPFWMNLAPLREKAEAEVAKAPGAGVGSNPRVLATLESIGARLDNIEKALFKLLLK